MKKGTQNKAVLLLAFVTVAGLSREVPPPATVTLDEIDVPGAKFRERERSPLKTVEAAYRIGVLRRKGTVLVQLTLWGILQPEVRFRRESAARRLTPETVHSRIPGRAAQLSGDRVIVVGEKSLTTVFLTLDPDVDEADGLPVSIPFGDHASLVNLDYVRLRDTRGKTSIGVVNGIHPQTRRCLGQFTLMDDEGGSTNRFILLTDSSADCRRLEQSREGGDLLFADSVPEKLRQAVLDVYGPVEAGFANRLGSEPGQVFVAWWPDSPHQGVRFERSWNRNSLLLFNGADWQQGLDPHQREALRTVFIAEQIQRRLRQTDWPGPFTDSAASYLLGLYTAGQAHNTSHWLADVLPGWIAGCAGYLKDRASTAASGEDVTSVECGLVVQFVYDAVARARSAGHDSLYDGWRRLLTAAYRRGESGANPAAFLASSDEAHRIVLGLLDGTVDWNRFVAELNGLGVRMRMIEDVSGLTVSVLSLTHFQD